MHNVRIEGSYAKGVKYLRDADQLMFRLREIVKAGGIENGGLHANFAPDVYAYARVGPGIAVVSIVADPDSEASESQESLPQFESTASPDFLCGIVYQGFITSIDDGDREYETLSDFRPDQRTDLLFRLGTDRQTNNRLAVKPYSVLSEELSGNGPRVLSQYAVLRPGFYSGAMKKLVQALMGYGKFPEKSIYGKVVNPIADAFYFETQYQQDVARNGTQIRYDWRFHRTHGLTKASDGRWWLIEIRQGRGAFAMPLALYESTTTVQFREKAEDIGDNAALSVIDLFGGFPTGESIPSMVVELEAMIRAGYVVRLLDSEDIQPFYRNLPYSMWHGWAFSENGSKADNTAWRVDPDKYQTGVHYRMEISIGEVDTELAVSLRPSPTASVALKRHVMSASANGSGMTSPDDFRFKIRAALLKIDRLTAEQTQSFLEMPPARAFDEIDALVMQPIAESSASVSLVSSSRIYFPYIYGPQFKFYDPAIGGVISHDGRAEAGAAFDERPTTTDATMHVFYVGESLHWVKFYHRIRELASISEIDGDLVCGLVGDQTTTTRFGIDDAANGVYTETYDERSTTYSSETSVRVVGRRVGVSSVQFSDSLINPSRSVLTRTWRFRIDSTTVTTTEGAISISAVAVPYGTRESYYYAFRKYVPGNSKTISVKYDHKTDAYAYTGWRNFPGYTGFLPMGCGGTPNFPACWRLDQHPAGCGEVTDRQVWEEIPPSADDECSDIVNAGSWSSPCAQIEGLVFFSPAPDNEFSSTSTPPKSELKVYWVAESDFSPVVTHEARAEGADAPFLGDRWFIRSPDDSGSTQFIFAQQNEMGSGSLAKISKNISGAENIIIGTPRFDDMEGESFTFVGVIDG